MIYGPGMLDSGLMMDPALLVADADIISMLQCTQKGMIVSDDTLCLDVIKEVGIKGEYLSNTHTFQNFKTEQSMPKMMVREAKDDWEAAGALNMYNRSLNKAREILGAEPKEIVPAAIRQQVDALIAQCDRDWK